LHGALLTAANHFDKIDEIGLKLALVEKRWLATFTMICKLCLVQGVQKSCDARVRGQLLDCMPPTQILILRNVKIQAQQNYLPKPLPRAKVLRHKSSPQVRTKKRKSCPSLVPRYVTIARHLNVIKIILHGIFDEKKSEIRF